MFPAKAGIHKTSRDPGRKGPPPWAPAFAGDTGLESPARDFHDTIHPMTALKVTLDAPLDRFVEDQVASGAYPDAAAVVRAGLAALQSEAARVARFKALVQEGLDDISAGRVEVVEDIGAWFDQIEAELDEAARVA